MTSSSDPYFSLKKESGAILTLARGSERNRAILELAGRRKNGRMPPRCGADCE